MLLLFISIIVVCGALMGLLISMILWKRRSKSGLLRKLFPSDVIWDSEQLKLNSNRTFLQVQDAWEHRDIDQVKDLLTSELHRRYKAMTEHMTENGELNIIRDVKITENLIIRGEYPADSNDRYIARISGTLVDYTINESTRETIKNKDRKPARFSDTYHFVKYGNDWLLEDIDNSVNLWELLKTRKQAASNPV